MQKTIFFRKNNVQNTLFVVFLSLLGSISSIAQIPELDWGLTFGGLSNDMIRVSEVDAQGNVINVGSFYESIDLDPRTGQIHSAMSGTKMGTFIQKLDVNGNFLWATAFPSNDNIKPEDVVVGNDGSIYVSGTFDYHVLVYKIDPNQPHSVWGNPSLPSMFLVKLDAQGNFVWGRAQSGGINSSMFLELDDLGNIYQIGTFDNLMDKESGSFVFDSVYPHTIGVDDFFIQKLDTSGNQLWFKTIKGANDVQAHAVKVNKYGKPIIAGTFKGSVDFDPGPGNYNMTSGGGGSLPSSGFVLQLNASGDFEYVVALEGTGDSEILDMEIDKSGDVFVAGTYSGQTDFDPGVGITNPPTTSVEGCFIEKLDSNGVMQWVHPYQNSLQVTEDYPIQICLDGKGNIYTTGCFQNADLNLEPTKPNGIIISSTYLANQDMFLAKHTSTGKVEWGYLFGGAQEDHVHSIILDSAGSLHLSGYYTGNSATFDYNKTMRSKSGWSMYSNCFLLKFKPCPSVLAEVKLEQSKAELVWDYNTVMPGLYNLRWYSCDDDSIIPGATDTTFSPSQNGNYALILESSSCLDTSDCFSIQNVGLEENRSESNIQLYPNPTNSLLYLENLPKNSSAKLYNLNGKLLLHEQFKEEKAFVDLSELSNGVYLLELKNKIGESDFRKVMVE